MDIFKHESHTAYALRHWSANKCGLVFIKSHSKIQFWVRKIGFVNWKFIFKPLRNFVLIRTPFFYLQKNNGGLEIGLPNFYLWVIK